jgi:putative DNA primase/helicase
MSAAQLLRANHILLDDLTPGRHYATCPQCSAGRKGAKQKLECLGITIEGNGSARWGCNHCGWTGPTKGNGAARPELTSYVYRDRDGAIRFRKVRNRPGRKPRFWLQKPDGCGGWIKGTKGVDTSLLYRADEIAEAIAAGRGICCAEGEKDVDNLHRLGFAATCNAHGASQDGKKPKWTAQHSAQLAGADLVVFNDNDDAGIAHAEATCRLSFGIAKRVRRLDLKLHWPDIPEGGDVSDWLAQGHGAAELQALVDTAPDYTPSASAETTTDDDAEIERLAKLSAFEYERARKAAAEALSLRASILDKLVAAEREKLGLGPEDGKQGRAIELLEPEPWPAAVAGAPLLDEITAAIGTYVIMNEHQRIAVTLWAVHAHLIDRTMISPRLALRSALHNSGKTTCLEVLGRLVPRALEAASVTPSAIFRVIAAYRPSLLIDEADTLFHDGNETLRGILNAGHRQGGTVLRAVGDNFEPRAFACYAATAIALIGQLPGTVANRSIDIVLVRRLPSEPITPFRLDDTASLDALARRMARWAKDNGERLSRDPQMPPGLHNRAADNWRPLLAIAEAAGGDWPQKARQAAMMLAGDDPDELSRIELLLSDIRAIFEGVEADENGNRAITSATLIEKLVAIVPRPWAEYGKSGKPITQNKLARLLKPLRIQPDRVSLDEVRLHGYRLTQFLDAFDRYLAPSPLSNRPSVQSEDNPSTSDPFQSVQPESGWTVGNSRNPLNSKASGWMDGLKRGNGDKTAREHLETVRATGKTPSNLTARERIDAARGAGAKVVIWPEGDGFDVDTRLVPDKVTREAVTEALGERGRYEEILAELLSERGQS